MDNNRDVSRFSPATKRHLHKPPPASEKSRKERFQKLSLVGTRVDPNTQMGSDQEDEQLISMLAAKRFKLPQKFLDENHASVPRKLRSAMKKRNTGSLSPPLHDSKKPKKHHPSGRDSPKTNPVKKIKKQNRAKSKRANESITKDEEEVVETLYALAGMFPDNGTLADESSQDPPTTVNQTIESPKLEGVNEVSLHEEATEAIKSKPKTEERTDLVDSIQMLTKVDTFAKEAIQEKTHLQSLNCEYLPIELYIDSQPMATNLEQQHKADDHNGASLSQPRAPVLWPGLFTASRNSIDASLRSSSNHESSKSCYSTEKICETNGCKASRKKCTGHVYISHLIRNLQNPDSKHKLSLQREEEEAEKQGIVNVGPGFTVLQNVRNRAVSTNLQQKSNGNERLSGSHTAQITAIEKQSFDFLSLSSGGDLTQNIPGTSMSQFQIPYVQSYSQHHIHPAQKIHYSNPYPDQLSTVSSHQLLPMYHPGSSGWPWVQKGPTREHQQAVWSVPQIPSAQYKPPMGSRQLAQSPSWQNGRVESSAVAMNDLMTQYNHNHHQQQYLSLRSSMALGKRQELHHLGGLSSSVAREETAMRFHRGSSLSLQLL